MKRPPRPRAVPLLLALLLLAPTLSGAEHAIDPFIGTYRGHSIADNAAGLLPRDLSVVIARRDKGFSVEWTTVIHEAAGVSRRNSYTITFIPTRRPNIYSSAMKTNVFGGRQAMDPLQGDPFFWARIRGRTLTVYALMITDEGGYEMQVYERTLSDGGDLELDFSRVRDGQVLRNITGRLERLHE